MSTERFHWTSPSGVEIVLPRMGKVKAGILRRHRKEEPVDFLFSMLEEISDAETLAKLDDLDSDDLNVLAEAWQSDVTPGESGPSSS